ncbi:MAG: SMC-Scp complex subunit ScpB [Peptoniphilus sp.]|nr:SMC-Scp complex subunit ScpB [Peptoniphilus sp.]MDY3119252.1 SMC-Scp complex subunit ScpB [Peptoniphilus sp.]
MELKAKVEALLFAWGDPLSEKDMQDALNVTAIELRRALSELDKELSGEGRGLRLMNVRDTYQLSTKPELFDAIAAFAKKSRTKSLSNAALETLSIVAYKQPVLKSEIEDIRGVRCDQVLKSLEKIHLITVLGRMEIPGRPKVYGTTDTFLRKFGLSGLEELPEARVEEGTEES